MQEKINENTIRLEAYGVGDFALQLQELVKQGFEVDISNEGYPTQYVGHFSCLMLKQSDTVKQSESIKEEAPRKGRVAKSE